MGKVRVRRQVESEQVNQGQVVESRVSGQAKSEQVSQEQVGKWRVSGPVKSEWVNQEQRRAIHLACPGDQQPLV